MTTAQLAIVCLTALTIVATVTGAWAFTVLRGHARPDKGQAPRRVGHRATVHTKPPSDHTFFGVISAEYSDRIVLEDAELIVSASEKHPLPGRQDINVREISWIDVHALVADTRTPATLPAPAEVAE